MRVTTVQGVPCIIGGPLIRRMLDAVEADACYFAGHMVFRSEAAFRDKKTRLHELQHHKQAQADPLFPAKYAIAHLLNGYENNPYEIEADQVSSSRARSSRSRSKRRLR
jgi:hypothetical protein